MSRIEFLLYVHETKKPIIIAVIKNRNANQNVELF